MCGCLFTDGVYTKSTRAHTKGLARIGGLTRIPAMVYRILYFTCRDALPEKSRRFSQSRSVAIYGRLYKVSTLGGNTLWVVNPTSAQALFAGIIRVNRHVYVYVCIYNGCGGHHNLLVSPKG